MQLGGVVIPHDGQCYLEQRGSIFQYTMAETLVSQAATLHISIIINFVHKGLSINWTHKFFTTTV